jgi:hypothetical protein
MKNVLLFFCVAFFSIAHSVNVNAQAPTITTFSPDSGPIGTTVTITGTNFDPVAANNIVYFGAVKAMVISATGTLLTVTAPASATYAPLTVTTKNLTAYSSRPFIITFANTGRNLTTASFADQKYFPIEHSLDPFAIGDFDGDGKIDVASLYSSGFNTAVLSVLKNTSTTDSISFNNKSDFPEQMYANVLLTGDIDGDGRLDLIAYNYGSFSVIRNTSTNGNIAFVPMADFVNSNIFFASDIDVADLDGDGKADIAILGNDGVYVYRNLSSPGVISLSPKINVAKGGGSLSIADLDGDRKPDLVITGGTVSVLRNISSPGIIGFSPATVYQTGTDPREVAIADFDQDGKPDLATPNSSSGTVSIWRNTSTVGSIAYSPKADLAAGFNPYRIATADLDGDGKPDLAVTNPSSNTISVLKNISTSGFISFAPRLELSAVGVSGLSVADFDGDGRPELAFGSISILKNQVTATCASPAFRTDNNIITNASCANNDGSISILPTCGVAPFMYSINGGATYVPGSEAGYTFTNLAPGTYKLRLKDAQGSETEVIERTVVITEGYPTFLNNALTVLNATCANNDGNINIIPTRGTAPFMYSINGGITYVPGPDAGYGFQGLAAGTYKLRLKDANGCESVIVERTVTRPLVNNSLIVLDATCANNDGNINIIPTLGTAPFMYSINGGTTYVSGPNTGYVFQGLAAGTYKPRLKDATGCESAIVERVVKLNCATTCTPPTFVNNGLIILDATCANNDGNINIIPTSSTAPFMYSINGGVTYVAGPNAGYGFQNLPSGTYKLRLKDANGCESAIVEREVKLLCNTCTPPTFVNNNLIVLDASCGKSDGAINIIPTSGTAPFMYSINGGATYVAGPNGGYGFQNLPAGTYQLRLKDSRGCESAIVERTVRNYYNCPGITVSANRFEATLALSNKDVIATYPNPNKGQFKLLLQNFLSPKAEVSVYDAKGTLVQKRSLNLTQNTIADFDLKGKAPGLYLIKVASSNGTKMLKVLVQ